jgi:hypothetical protein
MNYFQNVLSSLSVDRITAYKLFTLLHCFGNVTGFVPGCNLVKL